MGSLQIEQSCFFRVPTARFSRPTAFVESCVFIRFHQGASSQIEQSCFFKFPTSRFSKASAFVKSGVCIQFHQVGSLQNEQSLIFQAFRWQMLYKIVIEWVIPFCKSRVLLIVSAFYKKIVVPTSPMEHINVMLLFTNVAKNCLWVFYTFLPKPSSFRYFNILEENCGADIKNGTSKGL